MSFKWIFFPPPLLHSLQWTTSMSQQCHLQISSGSWQTKDALHFGLSKAIQRIQRKRSYSSEALLIEGKKSNYKREKMSLPSPGSSDSDRMTVQPYQWLLCSHRWLCEGVCLWSLQPDRHVSHYAPHSIQLGADLWTWSLRGEKQQILHFWTSALISVYFYKATDVYLSSVSLQRQDKI